MRGLTRRGDEPDVDVSPGCEPEGDLGLDMFQVAHLTAGARAASGGDLWAHRGPVHCSDGPAQCETEINFGFKQIKNSEWSAFL